MSVHEIVKATPLKSIFDFVQPVHVPHQAAHKSRKIYRRQIYLLTYTQVSRLYIQADGFVLAFRDATSILDRTIANSITPLCTAAARLIL